MARLFSAGSSQKLAAAGKVSAAVNNFAMAAWIYPTAWASGAEGRHFAYNGNDSGGWGMSVGLSGGNKPDYLWALYGAVAWFDTGYRFPALNTWYHALLTRESGTSKAYVNGVQTPNTIANAPNAPADAFEIGHQPGHAARYFDGRVAEVAVWDVALSAADALQFSRPISPLMVRPDGIVFYCPILGNYSPEVDMISSKNMTVTGATKADHPRIFYIPRPGLHVEYSGVISLTPDPIAVPIELPGPTLGMGTKGIAPDALASIIGLPAPVLTFGVLNLTPDPVVVGMSLPVPTLSWGIKAVSPDPVAIPIDAPSPALSFGVKNINPSPLAINLGIPIPTLIAPLTLGAFKHLLSDGSNRLRSNWPRFRRERQ